MADYKAPLEDIRFLLFEVFKSEEFWASLEGVEDIDQDTANAILEEAGKLCEQVLAPLDASGDEEGCEWADGNVRAPAGFKEAYQTFCEGAWCALGGSSEYGGMGMPKSLVSTVEELVQGANMAFGLAPMLTAGACLAINAHASDALKNTYLPKMYSGQWAGAMDLTEPHAGTDLGIIRTKAEPQKDGSYLISGTKIFITWGEHELAENIIHLVLAKTPDAPEGSRGISLFLVPKFLLDDAENCSARNHVSCGSLEKKMGIKGSATCVMNFDGAKGWLVGEENRGLAAMFTMMNYERLVVGIQGLGVADNSYQTALAYAKERTQGRSPSGAKSPENTADSLLVHADVRRMLMEMKVWNEGGRAFYLYVARWLDLAKYGTDPDSKALAESMVALLTPVTKSFITDRAFECCVSGQQVLGGHGFIREWGQEQRVRDVRITQIYEGTNGVQAMDLIGRKTLATKGEPLKCLIEEIQGFVEEEASDPLLTPYAKRLSSACGSLDSLTHWLISESETDPDLAGSAAVDYQNMLGLLCYGYMWLKMAAAASRSDRVVAASKMASMEFYFLKLMPQWSSLEARIRAGSKCLMSLADDSL